MTYKIDVPSVVRFLGGPKQIDADMKAQGFQKPISAKTAQKWCERGTIPMDRWLDLMALAERQSKRLEIRNFIKRS